MCLHVYTWAWGCRERKLRRERESGGGEEEGQYERKAVLLQVWFLNVPSESPDRFIEKEDFWAPTGLLNLNLPRGILGFVF